VEHYFAGGLLDLDYPICFLPFFLPFNLKVPGVVPAGGRFWRICVSACDRV